MSRDAIELNKDAPCIVKTGTVTKVYQDLPISESYTTVAVDLDIDGTKYIKIPVHYHCDADEVDEDGWKPFYEGDKVFVRWDDKTGFPKLVYGFIDGAKECAEKVFLIQNEVIYAIWTILEGGHKLKAVNYDLWPFVIKHAFYSFENPSTLKSDDTSKKHVFNIENARLPSPPPPEKPQYGKVTSEAVLIGVKNCFKDSNFDYGYSSLCPGNEVICYGRNSSYIKNGELIEDLQLCKINDTSGQIKYKINGVTIDGAVITFNDPQDIYAVLSPTKTIRKGDYEFIDTVTVDIVYDDLTNCGDCCDTASSWTRRYTQAYKFLFGDVLVNHSGRDGWDYGNIKGRASCVCNEYVTIEKGGKNQITGEIIIKDYDNINEDETFIIVYSIEGEEAKSTPNPYTYNVFDQNGALYLEAPPVEATFYRGIFRTDHIAYRLKGGSLQDLDIVFCGRYDRTDYKLTGDPCGEEDTWVETTTNYPQAFQGQTIFNVSCKIFNERYIVYTYTIHDYVGDPAVLNFYETSQNPLSADWQFKKRILGIINIETGERNEHEINDELLGQYKDIFDEKLASAIGFHT